MAVWGFSSSVLLMLLSTFVIAQVRGRSIEKRSDDSDPLSAVVEQLNSRLTQVEARVQVHNNDLDDVQRTVGFSLHIKTGHMQGLAVSQTIKFDDVGFNAGNGYNPLTGAFTAPTAGSYAFYLQVMANNDDPRIALNIMKNGQFIAQAHAGYSYAENGSTMVLTHLDQGDIINVQVAGGSSFLGGRFCSFIGFRISPQ